MILVDTTVWVDWFRGKKSFGVDALDAAIEKREGLATCGLVLTEILQGLATSREVEEVAEVFNPLFFIEPSRNTYLAAAELYRKTRRHGFVVRGTIDCVIAAMAIEWNLSLLENDRDYVKIAKYSKLRLVRGEEA